MPFWSRPLSDPSPTCWKSQGLCRGPPPPLPYIQICPMAQTAAIAERFLVPFQTNKEETRLPVESPPLSEFNPPMQRQVVKCIQRCAKTNWCSKCSSPFWFHDIKFTAGFSFFPIDLWMLLLAQGIKFVVIHRNNTILHEPLSS